MELPWRAPAASAGRVTFRVLLKQGETNGGALYWPAAPAMPKDQDLQLTEAAAPASLKWIAGGPQQSCDAACAAAKLGSCEDSALDKAATAPAELLKVHKDP